MSVVKIGDSLIIESGIVFRVVELIEFNGETYIYGFKAPQTIEEAVDPKDYKKAFLRQVIDEKSEEVFVEEIKDKELTKQLKQEIKN